MELEEERRGAVMVLRPIGPLTSSDAAGFGETALGAARNSMGRVVIDASRVAFVDSCGLETLVDVAEEISTGGRLLKVSGASDNFREVLQLTGISTFFDFYEDVTTAVRSFL